MSEQASEQVSEQLTFSPEQQREILMKAEQLLPDAEHAEKLRAGEKDPLLAINEARATVQETVRSDTLTNPLEQLKTAENTPQPAPPQQINSELKQITLRRELATIRRKLPAPEKALSKIIHQPVIRAVSETAGKTVSRPSGLLGGGLVALIGSLSYLYLAKHIGFTYNYGVFLVLFFGGFIFGIALELLVHLTVGSRRHAD